MVASGYQGILHGGYLWRCGWAKGIGVAQSQHLYTRVDYCHKSSASCLSNLESFTMIVEKYVYSVAHEDGSFQCLGILLVQISVTSILEVKCL